MTYVLLLAHGPLPGIFPWFLTGVYSNLKELIGSCCADSILHFMLAAAILKLLNYSFILVNITLGDTAVGGGGDKATAFIVDLNLQHVNKYFFRQQPSCLVLKEQWLS